MIPFFAQAAFVSIIQVLQFVHSVFHIYTERVSVLSFSQGLHTTLIRPCMQYLIFQWFVTWDMWPRQRRAEGVRTGRRPWASKAGAHPKS